MFETDLVAVAIGVVADQHELELVGQRQTLADADNDLVWNLRQRHLVTEMCRWCMFFFPWTKWSKVL